MRILQLIDSLEPGGAERMAVNFANEWANQAEGSFLITTNRGGKLSGQISTQVNYKIYNRTKFNILWVLLQLIFFIKKNKITHIQAHTSSYKWSKFIKSIFPKIKFYWHDHNGNRVNESIAKNSHVINHAKYFDGVIACNPELAKWSKTVMKHHNVIYLPNFATSEITERSTELNGVEDKRIVCLANFRNPKNHLFLIKAFHQSKISELGWTLHLVGKIYNDDYSDNIFDYIKINHLENSIFYYNMRIDTNYILSQCQIGVLVSEYEGFPVTLIEYGLMGLCPIVSNVGYMPTIVENNKTGFVINSRNLAELESVFRNISENNNYKLLGKNYSDFINKNYSANNGIKQLNIFFN